MTAAVIALAALAAVLAVTLVARSGFRLRAPQAGARRILVPFTGGTLDPTVLDAAIRLAHAESATLVPAYLLLVPLRYAQDSPLRDEVAIALPLLEAVEHAALRAGVPVDARIEKGRTSTHALSRLWDEERFDQILAPAPADERNGFTAKDLSWLLTHSPAETIVLKPSPAGVDQAPAGATAARTTVPPWHDGVARRTSSSAFSGRMPSSPPRTATSARRSTTRSA